MKHSTLGREIHSKAFSHGIQLNKSLEYTTTFGCRMTERKLTTSVRQCFSTGDGPATARKVRALGKESVPINLILFSFSDRIKFFNLILTAYGIPYKPQVKALSEA